MACQHTIRDIGHLQRVITSPPAVVQMGPRFASTNAQPPSQRGWQARLHTWCSPPSVLQPESLGQPPCARPRWPDDGVPSSGNNIRLSTPPNLASSLSRRECAIPETGKKHGHSALRSTQSGLGGYCFPVQSRRSRCLGRHSSAGVMSRRHCELEESPRGFGSETHTGLWMRGCA